MTRNHTINFIRAVERAVHDFDMLQKKDTVLAAVSGGPDSVALVLSLLALKEQYGLEIGIAHLNHRLRGKDADRDEAFAEKLARKNHLRFHLKKKDVAAHAKAYGLSIETAGRELRYDFFKETAQSQGYTKIATGHHKDDNAEMVLMNLLRGSGPKGLCGIPPVREKTIIRPLIQVTKKQIQDFLVSQNQPFMVDDSNTDPRYLRNKIRHRLIPLLQSEYNPEIMDALDRLSSILQQEEMFWHHQTDTLFTKCLIKKGARSLVLSKTSVSELEPALLNRVLRKTVKEIKKNLNRISHRHINDITRFIKNRDSGTSLDLPGQIRIYKTRDTVTIKREDLPLRELGKLKKQFKKAEQNRQNKAR